MKAQISAATGGSCGRRSVCNGWVFICIFGESRPVSAGLSELFSSEQKFPSMGYGLRRIKLTTRETDRTPTSTHFRQPHPHHGPLSYERQPPREFITHCIRCHAKRGRGSHDINIPYCHASVGRVHKHLHRSTCAPRRPRIVYFSTAGRPLWVRMSRRRLSDHTALRSHAGQR